MSHFGGKMQIKYLILMRASQVAYSQSSILWWWWICLIFDDDAMGFTCVTSVKYTFLCRRRGYIDNDDFRWLLSHCFPPKIWFELNHLVFHHSLLPTTTLFGWLQVVECAVKCTSHGSSRLTHLLWFKSLIPLDEHFCLYELWNENWRRIDEMIKNMLHLWSRSVSSKESWFLFYRFKAF